jgi:hypothetical protein
MKPILFNTEMVKAILDGRKTVTRRPIKESVMETWDSRFWNCSRSSKYAPYQTGDILYVRETWRYDKTRIMYKANYSLSEIFYKNGKTVNIKWRPSIHMPKEAARIFLKITDVRVERVQYINGQGHHDDVLKEGITVQLSELDCGYTPSHKFRDIWQNLYGDWDANPWVWVYEFEVVQNGNT